MDSFLFEITGLMRLACYAIVLLFALRVGAFKAALVGVLGITFHLLFTFEGDPGLTNIVLTLLVASIAFMGLDYIKMRGAVKKALR